jgi:hypothetical protein
MLLFCSIVFATSSLLSPNIALSFYTREFIIYAAPLLLAFSVKLDLAEYGKTFLKYCLCVSLVYLYILFTNSSLTSEDYMTFGYYAIFCAAYVTAYGIINKKKLLTILSVAYSLLIIINGNRGTLLVISCALVLSLILRKKRKPFIAIPIIASIMIGYQLFKQAVVYLSVEKNIDTYSINQFSDMLANGDLKSLLGGRYEIYQTAIHEINTHPLTGIGVGTYQAKYGAFPHNIFLDIFSTFGIIIGSFMLYLLFSFISRLYFVSKNKKHLLVFFIFLISINLKLLFSKVFIYDPFFWLLLAFGSNIITDSYRNSEEGL